MYYSIACFPSSEVRAEFLRQVRLWNLLDGLPSVRIDALNDGRRVRLRTAFAGQRGIISLILAFGGSVLETQPTAAPGGIPIPA